MALRQRSIAVLMLAGCFALALFAFSRAGIWLVHEDPLEHAPAAVVFAGKTPFRAMEAAKLYKAGWVREVWLTNRGLSPDEVALARFGLQTTPEYVFNRQVLERLGVRAAAIRVIKGQNYNTADEVRSIAHALGDSGGESVILVTSSYHTRRVKALWRILGEKPKAIVRRAPEEAFDAKHWWRDAADASAVLHEWFGLLNAWSGFPVKSEHW